MDIDKVILYIACVYCVYWNNSLAQGAKTQERSEFHYVGPVSRLSSFKLEGAAVGLIGMIYNFYVILLLSLYHGSAAAAPYTRIRS